MPVQESRLQFPQSAADGSTLLLVDGDVIVKAVLLADGIDKLVGDAVVLAHDDVCNVFGVLVAKVAGGLVDVGHVEVDVHMRCIVLVVKGVEMGVVVAVVAAARAAR